MRIHDDAEQLARQGGTHSRAKETGAEDVAHALSQPQHASVQTMLEVQRLAGNSGVNRLLQRAEDEGGQQRSPVLDVVGKGGGSPLGTDLRQDMEGRLGADFSDVKVHTDSKASESARAVQANAYTVGNEIVVRGDRWSPDTDDGKKTVAHELTHVMQQRAGPVAGTSQGDGISVSHPSDRFERAAEQSANSAMAAPAAPAASAQLHADENLQGQFVQRQGTAPADDKKPEDEEAQMQREAAAPEDEKKDEDQVAMAQMQREGDDEDEEKKPAG
jgi:hypothetical protein